MAQKYKVVETTRRGKVLREWVVGSLELAYALAEAKEAENTPDREYWVHDAEGDRPHGLANLLRAKPVGK